VEINKSKWNLKRNSRIKAEYKEESNWKLINKRGNQRGIKVEFKEELENQSGISKWNLKWKSSGSK
jgi:flagellar hook protein FlgE